MPAPSLRAPDGRPWTLTEVLQGRPLGHPSHAMFVHFPVAFYVAALVLDAVSRLREVPEAPLAATWLIAGAVAATVPAALTGLVDWWGMVPGSTKRRWATRHMVAQLAAFAVFLAVLLMRWPDRSADQASALWIALEVAGVVILAVGQWLGGVLVYDLGMRVSTARPGRRVR